MYQLSKPLLAAALALLTFSCGKKADEPAPETDSDKVVTMDKSSGVPGELLQFTTSFALEKETVTVKFGSVNAELGKINDTLAVMRVPVLPAGKVALDFSAAGVVTPLQFTINAYTPVDNPDQVKEALNQSVQRIIADLATTNNSAEVQTLNVIFATFNQEYAKLSDTEKKNIALQIRQMQKEMEETRVQAGRIASQLRNPIFTNEMSDDKYKASMDAVIWNMLKMTDAGGVAANLFIAPDLSASKLLSIVAAGITAAYFWETIGILKEVVSAVKINTGLNALVDISDESEQYGLRTGGNFKDPEGKLVLVNKKARSFRVLSNFRAVSSGDAGSENPLFSSFANAVIKLKGAYDKLAAAVNKYSSWFISAPLFPPFEGSLPGSPIAARYATKANLLSISNVSDTAIKLSVGKGDTTLSFTAQSASVKEDKAFTFDLTYTNTTLGVSHTKKVTATFSILQPIVGKWKIERYKYNYFNNGDSLRTETVTAEADEYLEFTADGKFHGKFEDNVGKGSWRIKDDTKLELFDIDNDDFDIGEFGLTITTLDTNSLVLYSKDTHQYGYEESITYLKKVQ